MSSLESQLSEERKRNEKFHHSLEEKEVVISRLNLDQEKLIQEKEELQIRLNQIIQKQEEENERVILKEIENCFTSLQVALSKLDSPTNLGNDAATAEFVVRDSKEVWQSSQQLANISSVEGSREGLVENLGSMSRLLLQLFDDTKGTSRKVDDAEARQKLLDAARAAGSALGNLLSLVKNVGGSVREDEDKRALSESLSEVQTKLSQLSSEAEASERIAQQQDNGEDLEDLAERELLAAARAIEEAAKALMSRTPEPRQPNAPINVADAILEAAMAITKATSMLVTAAAMAQKERHDKGVISGGNMYRRDPTWAQGLISAAKAVSAATSQLIETANGAVEGKIEVEAVVAASKAVAASTAQIVAACRAKAEDPDSPAQQKLNAAAKAITSATSQLVAAARAVTEREQEATLQADSSSSDIQKKVKEMELQTEILKLEKELQLARSRLFAMRKQQYK